jgi:hypothetical protein
VDTARAGIWTDFHYLLVRRGRLRYFCLPFSSAGYSVLGLPKGCHHYGNLMASVIAELAVIGMLLQTDGEDGSRYSRGLRAGRAILAERIEVLSLRIEKLRGKHI